MKQILLLLLCSISFLAYSQEENLPVGFAPGEIEKMPYYLENLSPSGITDPPKVAPRTMAEWEESQAVVIAWKSYPEVQAEIVRYAREECRVIIYCTNIKTVQDYLTSKNVDWSSNVEFVVGSYNTVWLRDYGPNPVYLNGVDSLALVDWIYNRPRPLDDKLPELLSTYMNLPLYSTTSAPNDLVNTGGNYMSDGMGRAFASKLVLDENGPNNTYGFSNQSEAQVDSLMYKFMGIKKYIKMNTLPYDGIHHIDMHMKLLDEQTMIVGEYPSGKADGPQIEANLQYVLSNFQTSFGTPFRTIRVVMPPDATGKYPNQGGDYRTYANALILNKTVLLPVYEEKYDSTAIRIWQEAMPGFKIRAINCNSMIAASGAIHCITHEIGVADPLLIQHKSLTDVTGSYPLGYPVDAYIMHRKGIQDAELKYRLKGEQDWKTVTVNLVDINTNSYEGFIPEQPKGSTVEYYIHATSTTGKEQFRPMPAPEGFYSFKVNELTDSKEVNAVNKIGDIYPNPASAITCIPVKTINVESVNICLQDMFGRTINSIYSGTLSAGEHNFFFNASDLSAGSYIIKYTSDNTNNSKIVLVK